MDHKPCPFCGSHLRPTRNGFEHPTAKEIGGRFCFMQSKHIGKNLIEIWDDRFTSPEPLRYDVVDGFPVFSSTGAHLADVEHLNDIFGYMKQELVAKWTNEKKNSQATS